MHLVNGKKKRVMALLLASALLLQSLVAFAAEPQTGDQLVDEVVQTHAEAVAPEQVPVEAVAPEQVPVEVAAPEQAPVEVEAPEQTPVETEAPEQAPVEAEAQEQPQTEPEVPVMIMGKLTIVIEEGKGSVTVHADGDDEDPLIINETTHAEPTEIEYEVGTKINITVAASAKQTIERFQIFDSHSNEIEIKDDLPAGATEYKRDIAIEPDVKTIKVNFAESVSNKNGEDPRSEHPAIKEEVEEEKKDAQESTAKEYAVSLRNQENCTLLVNGKAEDTKAKAGETVVVTAQYAKDIYAPASISVITKTEQKIQTEQTEPATYSFVMPESDVAVSAIYERPQLPMMSTRASHQVTYYDERYNEGLLRVGYFEVNGTKVAMCVCHEMDPPQVGDSLATIAVHTADNKTNEALRKAYYYGWHGPGDVGASYVETSLAGSVANGHDDNYYGYGAAFLNRIASMPAAPKGFSVTVISRGGAVQDLAYWDYNPIGAFELYKTSAIPDTTDNNSAYSLQGAVYGLYSNGSLVKKLTTDANGYAKVDKINSGTYQLKEITAPKGFVLDTKTYNVTINPGTTTTTRVKDDPQFGAFELYKTSAIPDMSDNNSGYSLQGAVYGLYSNGTLVTQLTTDANGYAKAEKMVLGTYQLKEITAPKGFALDTKTYNVTINPETTTIIRVKDYPQSDPATILLGKIDAETNKNKPLGSASLANAEFTVKYYEGNYKTDPAAQGANAKRTWVLKTDSDGFTYLSEQYKVSGDPFYYRSNGDVTLPLGTITITETKAPKGYLINRTVYTRNITATANGGEAVNTYNQPEVPETIVRGDVEIIKFSSSLDDVGSVKQPLEGVEFTITSNTTGQKWVIVTNKDGYASTKKLGVNGRGALPYDTYTISETKIPPGHGGMKTDIKNVVVAQDNVSLKYIIENTAIFAPIQVVKKDASTGEIITYAGAEFQLLDENKKVIEMIVSQYPTLIKTDTFVTDKNGSFVFPEMLRHGTYYLKEVKAPEGYLPNKELMKITISKMQDWEHPVVIEVLDENAMGQISLEKVDEETKEALAGAEFTVTAMEDIVTNDSTVRATKGEVVDTIVTDESGKGLSKQLFFGKYEVKETKAPEGFLLSEEHTYEVELLYQDQNTPVVIEDIGEIGNQPITAALRKTRKDSNTLLAGITFKIWEDGSQDEREYTTDEQGMILFKYLSAGKTYHVQETKTLPGYVLSDEVFTFAVDEQGYIDGKEIGEIAIENDWTKYEISKTDSTTGADVPDCELKLSVKKEDGTTEVVEEWVSDGSPHQIEMLVAGATYVLEEVRACDGYILANSVEFTVPNTGEIQKVEMQDEAAKGQLIINKVEEDTDQGLSHTEFDIYAAEDIQTADGTIRATKGELVDQLVTDAEGTATSKALFLGAYLVKETKQLPGFALSEKEYKVELIYKDDKTPIVTTTETIYNAATTLMIHKTQLDTEKDLSGVTFHVWKETEEQEPDSEIDSEMTVKEDYITDAEGRIEIKYLQPDSTYCIQEIKTLPGYVLDSDIRKIKVDKNGYIEGEAVHTFRMENDITKTAFSKKNLATKEELAGAHVQVELLENGSREIIEKWVTDGSEHLIYNLEVGKRYAYKELVAPRGFKIAEEIIFTVENTGEIQRIELFDEYSPGKIFTSIPHNFRDGSNSVRTGDRTMVGFAIALLLASGLAVGGVVAYKKRKGKGADEEA